MIDSVKAKRPNFVFIVADDLGYADLGCYGGRKAAFGDVSPCIDQLAAGGMKFTQGYSNSPVCSPTRFALMTGQYQYRIRGAAEEPITSLTRGSDTLGLPPPHPTLPSLLQRNGYKTALIGKWHLGYPPHFGPLKSGYDEFFGPMSGGLDYFTHQTTGGVPDLWEGDELTKTSGYLTDVLSERAVDYVRKQCEGSDPFFLSLHYTAPHWPWESRDEEHVSAEVRENLFHLHGGNITTYHKMIRHMDEGIGRIVDALRERGQLENTMILFTSDNGGERFSDNWPLVGGKMDLTEGGIRVPWVIHWPDVVAPGHTSKQHCMTMDWSATVLDAAGVACDPEYPLDGISMLSVLRSPTTTFERPMYWRMKHRSQRAYRNGEWKYLKIDENEYLFNVEDDARERANRAKLELQRLEEMRQSWERWDATFMPIPAEAQVGSGYTTKDMPSR